METASKRSDAVRSGSGVGISAASQDVEKPRRGSASLATAADLKRKLQSRHLQMIAIGGTIGTGLVSLSSLASLRDSMMLKWSIVHRLRRRSREWRARFSIARICLCWHDRVLCHGCAGRDGDVHTDHRRIHFLCRTLCGSKSCFCDGLDLLVLLG